MIENIKHVLGLMDDGRDWLLVFADRFLFPALGAAMLVALTWEIYCGVTQRRFKVVDPDCGFCASANGKPVTRVVRRWRWRGVVALETLNPLTPGHVVVVSRWHTRDAGECPRITAQVMRCAAELVDELDSANLIASKGLAASQKFFHLHAHVLPRREGDGFPMPWTGQVTGSEVPE